MSRFTKTLDLEKGEALKCLRSNAKLWTGCQRHFQPWGRRWPDGTGLDGYGNGLAVWHVFSWKRSKIVGHRGVSSSCACRASIQGHGK